MKSAHRFAMALFALVAFSVPSIAGATETGSGIYPNGAESFLTAAVPPPGYYIINYINYYDAQHLIGAHGNDLVPAFRVNAVADAIRFVHWSRTKLSAFQIGQQIILPFVNLNVSAAGAHQHKSGLGDVTFDPLLLSYQNARFHIVLTPEINFPTGAYNKGDLANIGRNYVNFEPVAAFTYSGVKNVEIDAKMMYDFNGSNAATHYTSGQEFHTDYAVGYSRRGSFAGIAGYYYAQTTNDTVNGHVVGADGFKGRVFSFGPDIHVPLGEGFLALKWEHETSVRNRTLGDKYWIKLIQHVGNI